MLVALCVIQIFLQFHWLYDILHHLHHLYFYFIVICIIIPNGHYHYLNVQKFCTLSESWPALMGRAKVLSGEVSWRGNSLVNIFILWHALFSYKILDSKCQDNEIFLCFMTSILPTRKLRLNGSQCAHSHTAHEWQNQNLKAV